jgi:4a-hydroxytetrahydrobiopterin dehydratase
MSTLTSQTCVPCRGGVPTLSDDEIDALMPEVPEWQLIETGGVKQIQRSFTFRNFRRALAFTNSVGELAEDESHHPAILTEWGKVTITLWTHAIGGLHQNDFILAAKIDDIQQ